MYPLDECSLLYLNREFKQSLSLGLGNYVFHWGILVIMRCSMIDWNRFYGPVASFVHTWMWAIC